MTQPFQMVGAPYLTDAGAIAKALNAMKLPGIVFDSTSQTVEQGYKLSLIHICRDPLQPRDCSRSK